MLHNTWNDLRYALRSLSRTPGFAAAAIVTIALGVGVNTGIFSIVNGMLFRDIPAPDAHELVSIYQTIEGVPEREGARVGLASTAEFEAYRDRATTLAAIAGHSDPVGALLGGDVPEQTAGLLVTCGYFTALDEPPAMGRALSEQDCRLGADPVVVLGHEIWAGTFGADPAAVGRTIELGRQRFTVVGVAREGTYGGMFRPAFFAPISAQRLLVPSQDSFANDRVGWLYLIGRRGDGADIDQVRAQLGVIAAAIDQQEPGRSTTLVVARAKPLTVPPFVRGAALGAGAVVMTAFALILLIACANVANLMLAHGATRSREIAVRLSLGATRALVIRRLLIESLLLSIAGGALGSIIALGSFKTLLALVLPTVAPVGLPPLGLDVSPDFRVLAITIALTFGTGVLFGLVPALHSSRPDLHSVMKQDSAGGGNRRGGRLQATFVGAQVALCMVLMIGAGLLLRGLQAAHSTDPGFDYRSVTVLSYDYVSDTGHAPDSAFWPQLQAEIAALPGVEATAYVVREPMGDDYVTGAVRLPGAGDDDVRAAELNWVSPGYFSVLELPILFGRTFAESEIVDGSGVAIVSESTARNLWPGADALGRTLLRRMPRGEEVELTIVGVAKDAQVRSLGQIDPYYVYMPARVGEKLLVKSRADFATTAAGIRGVVRGLDPGLPVPVYPLEANLERWRNVSGVVTTLAAALGGLALVLAAVGIYGVVSHFVGQRVREIGIRIALGAEAPKVLGLILRRTMRPVVIGAVLGIAGGVAASGILSSMLFGVSPVDAVGLLGSTLFVLCVALLSGGLVARRAARVDPMVTLRYE
jgi:putative ABC transport system permease protein